MIYARDFTLKSGDVARVRNAREADAEEIIKLFRTCREETDFLLSYNEESKLTPEKEREIIAGMNEAERSALLVIEYGGSLAGTAGFSEVRDRIKLRHRASFGVNILRGLWGMGLGKAIVQAVIDCARTAEYEQLELEVVAENERAVGLYKSLGFTEFGRNPRGFRTRYGAYQELISMRMEL
ncbi:MAG: GNAT family N-acetyltransferase [Oscillospiraceae bacterium]|nr:GNAT family N-acetyltransferase [Oscillospiraceae bacterium]MBR0063019.1 GNAT family N-acetyltransferase [Oscillospiraceae bacterium]